MLECFLEHINRRISRLYIVFSLNTVSMDQITFKKVIVFQGNAIVKTPKNVL
jgi:hypothetical protein